MVAKDTYVTYFEIYTFQIVVTRKSESWSAELKANRERFRGAGSSAVEAVESALRTVRTEKRKSRKGRPSNRYRAALTLLSRAATRR